MSKFFSTHNKHRTKQGLSPSFSFRNRLHIYVIVLLALMATISLTYTILPRHKPHTQARVVNFKNSQVTTSKINPPNLVSYINSYITTLNNLLNKTFHPMSRTQTTELIAFTKDYNFSALVGTHIEYFFTRHILNDIASMSKKDKSTSHDLFLLYYKCLTNVFQILCVLDHAFETNELGDIADTETLFEFQFYNLKFIYQQLHISSVLITTSNILELFKQLVEEFIESELKDQFITKFSKLFIGYLAQLESTMFQEFNENPNFTVKFDGEIPKLKFILSSFQSYKRFINVSFMFVYLNVLIVNEETSVVKLKREFVEANQLSPKKEYEIVKACGNLFIRIIEHCGKDLECLDDVFKGCKKVLQKIVTSELLDFFNKQNY